MERTIAAAWQEVLGVEEVGLDDNFFDLGGHSLLLARVRSRLAGKFPREVSVVVLFRYPTVRSLAEHLAGGRSGGSRAAAAERGGGGGPARRDAPPARSQKEPRRVRRWPT